MFMAAGLIAEAVGHDRIAELGGIGRTLPVTLFAFGLGGLSLIGVPPSGGFVAKWLLLTAAAMEGQWWWALVILVGGLLAGGYVIRVLAKSIAGDSARPSRNRTAVARGGGIGACSLRGATGARAAAAVGAPARRPR